MKMTFYVTRDIERALGLPLSTPGYFIISNFTPFSKQIAEAHENILLIDEGKLFDTHELLIHPLAQQFITTVSNPQILVFKNTTTIEKICAEKDWQLLNPSAKLAQNIEEKISQVEWLGELKKYLPPHKIQVAKGVTFDGTPFILQFNRAHTGCGTRLITSAEQLAEIQDKFPDRPVRITQFIEGPMLTSNNVVCADKVLVGNISYQITGTPPFTDNPFTTIGNDWHLPHVLLSDDLKMQYDSMAKEIGDQLRSSGWKGLFGIDVVFDSVAQKLYLIEINARQPASTTYESQLQREFTVFEAHLAALLNIQFENSLREIQTGAQIILRVGEKLTESQEYYINKLLSLNLDLILIPYTNTELGSDWIRIQSTQSLFSAHNEMNELGEKIRKTIV
jgi:hypothetical protein